MNVVFHLYFMVNVIMLSVIMRDVIMRDVIMLSVVLPEKYTYCLFNNTFRNKLLCLSR